MAFCVFHQKLKEPNWHNLRHPYPRSPKKVLEEYPLNCQLILTAGTQHCGEKLNENRMNERPCKIENEQWTHRCFANAPEATKTYRVFSFFQSLLGAELSSQQGQQHIEESTADSAIFWPPPFFGGLTDYRIWYTQTRIFLQYVRTDSEKTQRKLEMCPTNFQSEFLKTRIFSDLSCTCEPTLRRLTNLLLVS